MKFKTYKVMFKLVAGETDTLAIRVNARNRGEAYSKAYKKATRQNYVVPQLMYIEEEK